MNLQEILTDPGVRALEFPITREKIFLAHAGVCPLPRRVADAIRDYAGQCTLGDQETLLPALQLPKTRELAARLLEAQPDEIAFVGPTSLALSYVASGLSFGRGDNIVIYLDDYPSNVYPWMALAAKEVDVRFLKVSNLGEIHPQDVENQIDDHTRLVALPSCHFISGFRVDLSAIGELLRQRGILFCVDAIQTVGAFKTSIQHVDFLAADGHKWMLGPCAAGLLYVRKDLQSRLSPPIYGWHNVRCPGFIAQENMVMRRDARRYEAGTHNWLGLVGLHAALEILLEIGIESISEELRRKRAWLLPALIEKGYHVLNAEAPSGNVSGITTFYHPQKNMGILHQQLEQAKITTSLRTDRAGRNYLRVSPHFYNTDEELDQLLQLL